MSKADCTLYPVARKNKRRMHAGMIWQIAVTVVGLLSQNPLSRRSSGIDNQMCVDVGDDHVLALDVRALIIFGQSERVKFAGPDDACNSRECLDLSKDFLQQG